VIANNKGIVAAYKAAEHDWVADKFFVSGKDTGTIFALALGPVVPTSNLMMPV